MNYIPYLGNKSKYSQYIIRMLSGRLNKPFIEPFGGSGAVSLEVSLNTKVFLNEIDVNIFRIHRSFKHGTYEVLKNIINEIWSIGDPINEKAIYYDIRKKMNEVYFNTDSLEEGFYNWVIAKFAINSMVRFGTNGFNQGWGNRGVSISDMPKNRFDEIQKRYTNIELSNKDFFTMGLPAGVLFVDPPYTTMGSGTYSFTSEQHDKFIDTIKTWPDEVVYTDVFSENIIDRLGNGWDFVLLRDNMGYASTKKNNKKESEALYFNFKRKSALW